MHFVCWQVLLLSFSVSAGLAGPVQAPKLRAAAPALRPPVGIATKVIAGDGPLRAITLQDALGQALENNLDAKFEKVAVNIERARLNFASGVFEPVFNVTASRDSIQRPDNTANLTQADSLLQQAQLIAIQQNTQAIQRATGQPVTPIVRAGAAQVVVFDLDTDRFEAGLQFRTALGTRFALRARQSKIRSTFEDDTRSITPFYTAFGGLEVRQPLLKDFGPSANLADIRAARVNVRVAELNWRNKVSTTAQQVMSTYFDMLFSLADLAVKQDAVAADEKIVKQNARRVELGFMSPIDVQHARAAVSQDKEALLVAKNLFMERQFLLKRLILDDYKATDVEILVPVALPDIAIPKLDRATLLQAAFAQRLDYQAAVTEAEVQQIRLKFARNQLWPQLDLVGSYGYNGLAFDYSTAREKAYHSQAPEWSAGVQLSIPFGRTQAKAQLNAVLGSQEQALIKIKQVEQAVMIDVNTVLSRIETLQQRLDTARQTVDLNEEAVRIATRRLEEGIISSFDVIEFQRRLYDAKSRELAARADLNKAITQLWLATGAMLDEAGIRFKDQSRSGASK